MILAYFSNLTVSNHVSQTGNFVMRTEDLPCAPQIPRAGMEI